MAKKRVVVLYGGRADEHSISCISTAGVLNAMDTERFEPIPIGITKDGKWIIGGEDPRGWNLDGGELPTVKITPETRPVLLDPSLGKDGFLVGEPGDLGSAENGSDSNVVNTSDPETRHTVASLGHVDAVLPVLHGPYGEDGTIQGLLEMMGVPYVGCGVFASAACMDKHFTKVVLSAAGIATAPGITVDARNFTAADVLAQIDEAQLTYPLFVKPSRAGSSFGVTKVEAADDHETQLDRLTAAIATAGEHDWKVLIEQGIDGREVECAVLCAKPGDEPEASWPGEIVLDHQDDDQFYDFDSKYMDASASHVEVPANLPVSVLEDVRDVARRAFKAVDGAGLSRVDTFVTPDGSVMVNEINTMPGFTPISMYPKAWEATGVSYTELITRLIEGVLR
ncbi:D-alanine--D-alanine ligase family protein [Bifidobacterium myosotis]|uniref:D-alanine--D-alanine ligase n=1 Tax=Bifidobacterium myosotis TaxID=1630166 RepID=A0A5M9ZLJ8_9BIFI|nr:D-alanine--D-alanine ligase family protein [Bifidobacterium myosotis]KAA8828470.1 D-alanine--D-alanine ligase [Bifidobacterium myosotis]